MSIFESSIRELARNIVWANPNDDRQIHIRGHRLTPVKGQRGNITKSFLEIIPPKAGQKFIYYTLPPTWPKSFGFDYSSFFNWRALDDLDDTEKMLIHCTFGFKVFPLNRVYIKRENSGLNYLAVHIEGIEQHFDFNEDCILRFYSNSWFATAEAKNHVHIRTWSGVVGDDTDSIEVINKFQEYEAIGEKGTICFRNGYYVSHPNIPAIEEGDTFTMYYDGSIVDVIDTPAGTNNRFVSDIDGKRKRILQVPSDRFYGACWVDDTEFFIVKEQETIPVAIEKGAYYPVYTKESARNITFTDFSIDSEQIADVIASTNFLDANYQTYIRMYIRRPKRKEINLFDSKGMHDYYVFNDEERLAFLKEEDLSIPEWSAKSFEASKFMEFAFNPDPWMADIKDVFNFYGNQRFGTMTVTLNEISHRMPAAMRIGGIIIEFDTDGLAKETHMWHNGNWSQSYNSHFRGGQVRTVPGVITANAADLDIPSLAVNDPASETYEERYFRELPTDDWTLAKEDVHFSDNGDGTYTWDAAYHGFELVKRDAKHITHRKAIVSTGDLGLGVDIFENGSVNPSGLGFGHYYVIMNERLLTKDVDYQVIWPKLHIVNTDHVDPSGTNDITIIGHGCPGFDALPITGFLQNKKFPLPAGEVYPVFFRNKDFRLDSNKR
jgi:hypothetical protein